MSDSPYIIEINENNFEQVVIQGSRQQPVLVDFWASWCQPCKMLMPVLAQLAEAYQGRFILAKLNTEENQALATQFGIRSIPNVKLFIDGQEVDEFAGALPENAIREFLDKHLPRASDAHIEQAMQAWADGDADAALEALREAHSTDPDNPRVPVAMARIQVARGDIAEAQATLDTLPAAEQMRDEVRRLRSELELAKEAPRPDEIPALRERLANDEDDSEARYQLALGQIAAQDHAAAVDNLLTLMRKDRHYRDDAARKTLLQLFELLGDDPLVAQARRQLFNMMH
jgi:putative thioredoxin